MEKVTNKNTKSIVVFYHADCPDGFGGAWAAWRKFKNRATYIPLHHGDPPPLSLSKKTIYYIDISSSKEILSQLRKRNYVVVLEHHVSRKEDIKAADEYYFGTTKSGATLAWNYFHKGKRIPKLLAYVTEGDIWRFKTPQVREMLAVIYIEPRDFSVWNKISGILETNAGRKRFIEKGLTIRTYALYLAKDIADRAEIGSLKGHKAAIVNTPVLHDEVLHMLYAQGFPVAVGWSRKKGMIHVSLRSNGKAADVSKIAKSLGGGGHKASSGFSWPTTRAFPWKYAKIKHAGKTFSKR